MNLTPIEWVSTPEKRGLTWNPISGCPGPKVSPGCSNCYAERTAKTRLAGRCGYDADDPFGIHVFPERWLQPLQRRKPARIFVCSMGDLFHGGVSDTHIATLFGIMALCPQHTFIVLTKRHERMESFISNARLSRCVGLAVCELPQEVLDKLHNKEPLHWPLPNVVLMVTVCNQAEAEEKIPVLLRTPAAMHGVSVEPMLGPVDFTRLHCSGWVDSDVKFVFDALQGRSESSQHINFDEEKLDWVICGGESGPKARPMHPDWVRSLRDQCGQARVPFFFKGWGEWTERDQYADGLITYSGEYIASDNISGPWESSTALVCRVGKRRAGRLLDGEEWNEAPL
ncbi:phage Gp37/Gp68 family protein [Desulfovibrio sp. OttesenSCG-928-G11]|nr:phage Gp37/Gp68 family protein [Desulfovibrio sp. OttesenSCG-928-G11]